MIELHHNNMSSCAQKVRLALEEKGLAWESRHLDLRARDQHKPAYLKLNPGAVVPTLVHDGFVVIESTVINEYIDDAFEGPALRPADAAGKARMRLWTKKLDEGLHADTGVLSTSIAFRYQKFDKGEAEVQALIDNTPDPVKRERVRANIREGVKSRYFAASVLRFDALLARMEETLTQSPWLAGNAYSLADINYAPYITRLDHLRMQAMWDERPHVAAWYARLAARPAYQTAFVKWFSPAYLELMKKHGEQEWPVIAGIIRDNAGKAMENAE